MSNNTITIYQANTTALTCEISSSISLTNFNTYFQVKKEKDEEVLINSTGSLALYAGSYTGSYALTATDTDLAAGSYFYEVFINSGSAHYTVSQDNFIIKDSIV